MSTSRFRRPGPATVIACLALGVALGGTGYAATQINGNTIKPGTITSAQLASQAVTEPKVAQGAISRRTIRNAAIGAAQIADGGVTTAKVQNGAITREKIASSARRVRIVVRFSQRTVPINTVDTIVATCQSGETPLSGGFGGLPSTKQGGGTQANILSSRPNPTNQGATPTGWQITVDNASTTRATVTAFVVCGSR